MSAIWEVAKFWIGLFVISFIVIPWIIMTSFFVYVFTGSVQISVFILAAGFVGLGTQIYNKLKEQKNTTPKSDEYHKGGLEDEE